MESLKTILYFSIFQYPLTKEEIHSYNNHDDFSTTQAELDYLVAQKVTLQRDGFYVYPDNLQSIAKRLKGNLEAKKALIIAKKRAAFISKFPYVKAVGVSGSLSKGYYDDESDIDFFIITKHSKLWICRTFLILYKKIFLLNSRKYFCTNYFISENHLEIEEQNRFTATELKTLIPLQGKEVFEAFFKENNWVSGYFSNFKPTSEMIENTKKPFITKGVEFVFNTKFGSLIDLTFKSITLKKWNSKFHYLSKEEFEIALKTTTNISKHHPSNFQKKVISALNEKIEKVQKEFKIELSKEYV